MKIYLLVASVLLLLSLAEGKKKKSASSKKVNLFDSKSLNCLVCKALVEEMDAAVNKVDPTKKVEVGTFRINGDGTQSRKLIPFARSQEHLTEVVDNVCKGFEDYAQAKHKSNGEPTIIRLMTHQGNMNPMMGQVDIVPDEDLNTKLKFYCENIVEDLEDTLLELFAAETENMDIELCSKRSKYCEPIVIQDDYEFEKEEL
eukprot:GFUD01006460.1.p1 GENE.GFUD01006460.1~~GFUD01006460.1.p1  ORF type:complete len:201 (-),score=51.33 GFUD01006460.1:649-1251(-)